MDKSSGAAPTGCYKCGRPGHWSRDCPANPTTTTTDDTDNTNPSKTTPHKPSTDKKPKVRAPRRSLPKLTPEILLSEAGLGHILRYFPRALKSRGRGHEVDDLQHLLGMYAEWHSRLLPYYNFNQFIQKVEQVASTKRVKITLRELRDRISNGADPTKLHEKQDQQTTSFEQDAQGGLDMPSHSQDNTLQKEGTGDVYEDMLQDLWENATEDTSQPSHVKSVPSDKNVSVGEEVHQQISNHSTGSSTRNQISEEQKARMEANRLKALERPKFNTVGQDTSLHLHVASVPSDNVSIGEEVPHQIPNQSIGSSTLNQITEEQKARMETNRLKALEKAAARRSLKS